MRIKALAAIITFLCLNNGAFAEGEKQRIVLAGSDWCPYICTEKDNSKKLAENPGYLIEIARHAFKDYEIRYEAPSWKRSIHETRKGNYDAVVGIFTSVAPDFIYPEKRSGYSQMCFYVQKDNPWEYRGIDSLSYVVMGIIEGYSHDEGEVDAYKPIHNPAFSAHPLGKSNTLSFS